MDGYEKCHGTRQSPINVDTEDIVKVKMGDISFYNYRDLHELDIENNGHTLLINVPKNSRHSKNSMMFIRLATYSFSSKANSLTKISTE